MSRKTHRRNVPLAVVFLGLVLAGCRHGGVEALEADQAIGLINVNTASADQLETLPHVGEILAKRIIAGRPYGIIEDLLEVDGIGGGTLAKIRDLVSVGAGADLLVDGS